MNNNSIKILFASEEHLVYVEQIVYFVVRRLKLSVTLLYQSEGVGDQIESLSRLLLALASSIFRKNCGKSLVVVLSVALCFGRKTVFVKQKLLGKRLGLEQRQKRLRVVCGGEIERYGSAVVSEKHDRDQWCRTAENSGNKRNTYDHLELCAEKIEYFSVGHRLVFFFLVILFHYVSPFIIDRCRTAGICRYTRWVTTRWIYLSINYIT